MNRPDLSIGIISYNQGRFIEKAIRSVIGQKTTFNIELIICDDSSDDDTSETINQLKDIINIPFIFLQSENTQGPLYNGKKFFNHARGRYLSFLEADDYWCNDDKIQKQLEFLESHTEYAGCFHDAIIISNIGQSDSTSEQVFNQTHGIWKSYSQFNKYAPDIFPWDILQRKIIPTASLVFRNVLTDDFFEKYKAHKLSVSWALHLEIIKNSKFRYFNEPWSVYFDHVDGFSKSIDLMTYKLNNIQILQKLIDDDYYRQLIKDVYRAIANEYYHLLHCNDAKKISTKQYNRYCRLYKQWMKKSLKYEVLSFKKNFKK